MINTEKLYQKASGVFLQVESAMRLPVQEFQVLRAISSLKACAKDFKTAGESRLGDKFDAFVEYLQGVVVELKKEDAQRTRFSTFHNRGSSGMISTLVSVALGELPKARQLLSDWYETKEESKG